jgi:hypothetical protein
MVLEQLGVAPQGIDRTMVAHVHHFEDAGTIASRRREKARAQRVTAVCAPFAARVRASLIPSGYYIEPSVCEGRLIAPHFN